MVTAPVHIKQLIHLHKMNCVFIKAACRGARTRAFHYAVQVADTDQKSINLLRCVLRQLHCAEVCQWVYAMIMVAREVIHHASEGSPPRPLSASQPDEPFAPLFSDGVRRAVTRSALHHPSVAEWAWWSQATFGSFMSADVFLIGYKMLHWHKRPFSHHHVKDTKTRPHCPLILPLTSLKLNPGVII